MCCLPVVGINIELIVEAIDTREGATVVMCLEGDIKTSPELAILDIGADMTEVHVIEVGLCAVLVLLMSDALKLVIGSVIQQK